MTRPIGLLVVHGMGSQSRGFSARMEREITKRVGQPGSRLLWEEVYWADVLEGRETALLEIMKTAREPDLDPIDLDWMKMRKFVIHNFGDAIAYQRDWSDESTQTLVHTRVHERVVTLQDRLGDPGAPIVVLAHSLGAHILSNYIWDTQSASSDSPFEAIGTLAGMVTFGCNIPLFSLAWEEVRPINLPGRSLRKPEVRRAARWLNFLDADDVLGWPLRPLYQRDYDQLDPPQRRTVDRIDDFEINVGSPITAWNPAAHAAYWTDNDLTIPIAEYLKTLFVALDA